LWGGGDNQYYLNEENNNFQRPNGSIFSDEKLKIFSVKNGILQAKNGFGVFYEDSTPLEIEKISTGNNTEFPKRYVREKYKNNKIDFVAEEVIFGGVIGIYNGHFGHFLVETINRIWIYLDDKYKDTKIIFFNESNRETKYIEFFTLFGLKKENIIILEKDVRFKNILIPEISFSYNNFWCSSEYAGIFEKIRQNVPNKYNFEKIYLTRFGEKNNSVDIYGEEKIQNIFRKNGFEVIRPTDYDIMDQISLIKNCKILAGCSGTALHWALCMENESTVICLNRDINGKGQFCQQSMNRAKQHNSVYIDAYMVAVRGVYGVSMVGVTEQLKRFFDDNNFKYDVEDTIIDRNELMKVINKYSELQKPKKYYLKLFGLVNMIKIADHGNKKKIYVLNIPFIKIKTKKENVKDVYLFNCIPVIRIKNSGFNKKKFYLFGIIYILKLLVKY
jgi:hypothetical protein